MPAIATMSGGYRPHSGLLQISHKALWERAVPAIGTMSGGNRPYDGLLHQVSQQAFRLAHIAATEKIQMIENVIELI